MNEGIDIVVTAPYRHTPPPGEYHYSKLANAPALKQAFQKEVRAGRFDTIHPRIDHERDIVGFYFDVHASDVQRAIQSVRRIIDETLGPDNNLEITGRAYGQLQSQAEIRPAPASGPAGS
jgi:hypothetical protein